MRADTGVALVWKEYRWSFVNESLLCSAAACRPEELWAALELIDSPTPPRCQVAHRAHKGTATLSAWTSAGWVGGDGEGRQWLIKGLVRCTKTVGRF